MGWFDKGGWTRIFDIFNMFGLDQQSAPLSLPGSHSTSLAEEQHQSMMNAADSQIRANQAMANAPAEAAAKAKAVTKRKKAAMTDTIYTSPLGIAGEAGVARKTLLGQ